MKRNDLKYRYFENTSLLYTHQITLKYCKNFFASPTPFYTGLGNKILMDFVIRLKALRMDDIFEFAERYGFITHQQLLMGKTNK